MKLFADEAQIMASRRLHNEASVGIIPDCHVLAWSCEMLIAV
jgi:hypothetical protein